MDNFAVREEDRVVIGTGDEILFALVVLAILTATAQSVVQMTWLLGSR